MKSCIRILENDNNRRGDLFGRLMSDLFVALGYEAPSLNIHKSGRELDLSANHRLEPRRAIGECKATVDSIGGDDINKFVGALDAEQDDKLPITGYFISLAGFKETAIEQERQRRHRRVILVSGDQVVQHLIVGRILVSEKRATEIAGRGCMGRDELALDPELELLAHNRGWIWAVYFWQAKLRTHFVLIHSDGTPLARALANEVIASDTACGGPLETLSCLNPEPASSQNTGAIKSALAAYREYLESECGFIQLDGLPADTDVGARRLRLENLFVPLHLDLTPKKEIGGPEQSEGSAQPDELEKKERQPVGAVLAEHPRLALLAPPGGGKSTLLKRLAVAYADDERRRQIADKLPDRHWLPLFIRCRELRSLARGSFAELLDALSEREPVRLHGETFRAYLDRLLLAGEVLLLIDGLDEISEAGDRAAFVCTLRSALQAYPGVAIVVTSREAGFRHVAAHLAPICTRVTLSPFNADDITRLCVGWHREVLGNTDKIRIDAEQLANTIMRNDRIRRLALNPLLLTTLLLVKRWVGSLPTRRAILYGKAVELLLMTWNVEGHQPIPQEEALPQLCYVASAMMLQGTQKISLPRLTALLKEARTAMPTELGYVQGTVDEFIQRVEERSSLLMMSGLDIEDGQLVGFFEFRHLTFQEFLTAKAMVEGWHPKRKDQDSLVTVLEPHFNEEKWGEVVPLAAVLGGKATERLIQKLTEIATTLEPLGSEKSAVFLALGNSLADEAAARPDTIRAALTQLVRLGPSLERAPFTEILCRGRYKTDLREEAWKAFLSSVSDGERVNSSFAQAIAWQSLEGDDAASLLRVITYFDGLMSSPDWVARTQGALGIMFLGHLVHRKRTAELPHPGETFKPASARLVPMLFSSERAEYCAAVWASAWMAELGIVIRSQERDVSGRMFVLWQENSNSVIGHFAAWTLAVSPMSEVDGGHAFRSVAKEQVLNLLLRYSELSDRFEKPAALLVAWGMRALDSSELALRAAELLQEPPTDTSVKRNLRQLIAAVNLDTSVDTEPIRGVGLS